MNQAVGGEDFAAVQGEFAAVEVGDFAACFFDQKEPGGGVPRVQFDLPEGFQTSASDVR